MSKNEVMEKLSNLFSPYHVSQWLARFPNDYRFSTDYVAEFVDYINGLPVFIEEPK